MLQQHPPRGRRRRLRGRFALRESVEQVRHVQPAIRGQHDVEARRLELDLGEGPRPPEQARELEIDEEPVEAEKGPSVGLLEAEVLDLQLEQERVQPDVADLRPPLELRLYVPGHVCRDQPGDEEEAGERVRQNQGPHHGEGDEERTARD